jgi:predicted transcriptional regulator
VKVNVLISIKPKYVHEILSGKKKYEYRKSIFRKEIDKIYIYSTSPEQKIVGYFKYTGHIYDNPEEIWKKTREYSGIDKESYYKYFNKNSGAYAIKIEKVYVFKTPIDPKQTLQNFIPPQSYIYLGGDIPE